jgi:DNA-directed RNA polymerase subunit H (RpoH/RPB5)
MAYLLSNPKRGQNILTTVAQMLEDRGYVLDENFTQKRAQLEKDVEMAREYYATEELLVKGNNADEKMDILVMCPKEDKLAIDTVRRYVKDYKNEKHVRLIIIIQNITPAARQEVQLCKRFELFYEQELYRNKTRHALYVPHRALNDDEEQAILKLYRCKKENFPLIRRRSDPIARYFGWAVGRIVEISHRPGGSQEPFKYYRVVVDE